MKGPEPMHAGPDENEYCGSCGRSRPACWCHLGLFDRFLIKAAEDSINAGDRGEADDE